MDRLAAFVFLSEIQVQADFALNAVEPVNIATRALATMDSCLSEAWPHQNEVFRNLHSFLIHASNISKILWPPRAKRCKGESKEQFRERDHRTTERGAFLREILKVEDDHPLRQRILRDHLEHFDQRLDEWQAESTDRNYLQNFIGDVRKRSTIAPVDQMRSFDPERVIFSFRGVDFDLHPIWTALVQLKQRAATAAFWIHNGPKIQSMSKE